MKHLKIFENSSINYWLLHFDDEYDDFKLFSNKQSLENYILDMINEELEENDLEPIINLRDAINWYNDTSDTTTIDYKQLTLINNYKLPEKLKRLKEVKKYNL